MAPVGAVLSSAQVNLRDVVSNPAGIRVRQIGQDNDGHLVIHVPGNVSFEALPGTAVIKHSMAAFGFNEPAEAILTRVGLTVREFCDRPNLRETRVLEQLLGI